MGQTIRGITPTGTEYTATATTPLRGLTTRMRFDVEVPAKGVSFVATYDAGRDALMSLSPVRAFGKRVGLQVTDEVRAWIAECERQIREAEEAKQAERRRIADGITRGEDGSYVSADGIYSYRAGIDSYVALDSGLTGLPDDTQGEIGKFPVYLQHPDERVSQELVQGARAFYGAVCLYQREERERRELEREGALEEEANREEREARARAEETGERAEIRRYADDCNDRREECSLDIVTAWAMPDGTIETTRMHTW